ncbi:MAG: cytochrome c oxidase subunit 3 [Chloroflexota bacterium]
MQTHNLLENQLSRDEQQTLRNKRAGMFIFQVSWIMAFLCMVVVNWQLRFSSNWKPEGTPEASPMIGALATVALVISTALVWRSVSAIRADAVQPFLIQWLGTIGLGLLFVGMMLYEWVSIQTGTKYSLTFRLMTGFHMVHALVIGGYMLGVYFNARQGTYDSVNNWAIEAGAKLWTFVLVAWMIFYVVIYWV